MDPRICWSQPEQAGPSHGQWDFYQSANFIRARSGSSPSVLSDCDNRPTTSTAAAAVQQQQQQQQRQANVRSPDEAHKPIVGDQDDTLQAFYTGAPAVLRRRQQRNRACTYGFSANHDALIHKYGGSPWLSAEQPAPPPTSDTTGLHDEIVAFHAWMSPRRVEQDVRRLVLDRVSQLIRDNIPDADVGCFGSFATGIYLPTSDIDVVVSGSWPQGVQGVMHCLANVLRNCQLVVTDSVKILDRATVPIIKIVDAQTDIRVDISFNMPYGVPSARLIQGFLAEFPPLKYLVYVLKQFLLQRDLNEVFTGGVSSYSLILLTVSFFQMHTSPCVRQSLAELRDSDVNLGVLLMQFLELYGRHFNYLQTAIRVKDGGSYAPKDELMLQFEGGHKHSMLCIEDPLNPTNDIGRSSHGVLKVRQAFDYAYGVLTSACLHQTSGDAAAADVLPSVLSRIVRVTDSVVEYRANLQRLGDQLRPPQHQQHQQHFLHLYDEPHLLQQQPQLQQIAPNVVVPVSFHPLNYFAVVVNKHQQQAPQQRRPLLNGLHHPAHYPPVTAAALLQQHHQQQQQQPDDQQQQQQQQSLVEDSAVVAAEKAAAAAAAIGAPPAFVPIKHASANGPVVKMSRPASLSGPPVRMPFAPNSPTTTTTTTDAEGFLRALATAPTPAALAHAAAVQAVPTSAPSLRARHPAALSPSGSHTTVVSAATQQQQQQQQRTSPPLAPPAPSVSASASDSSLVTTTSHRNGGKAPPPAPPPAAAADVLPEHPSYSLSPSPDILNLIENGGLDETRSTIRYSIGSQSPRRWSSKSSLDDDDDDDDVVDEVEVDYVDVDDSSTKQHRRQRSSEHERTPVVVNGHHNGHHCSTSSIGGDVDDAPAPSSRRQQSAAAASSSDEAGSSEASEDITQSSTSQGDSRSSAGGPTTSQHRNAPPPSGLPAPASTGSTTPSAMTSSTSSLTTTTATTNSRAAMNGHYRPPAQQQPQSHAHTFKTRNYTRRGGYSSRQSDHYQSSSSATGGGGSSSGSAYTNNANTGNSNSSGGRGSRGRRKDHHRAQQQQQHNSDNHYRNYNNNASRTTNDD